MSVHSTHLAPLHGYSKFTQPFIHLLADLGVSGDAHCGATVQHRYDMEKQPEKPNLKQVHLIPLELLQEPGFRAHDGLPVLPGDMGENITTKGLDLYALGAGYKLHFTDRSCWMYDQLTRFVEAARGRAYIALTAITDLATILALLFHKRQLAYPLLLPVLLVLMTLPSLASWCRMHTLSSGAPIVRATGRRKPCLQIDGWRDGLMKKCYKTINGRRKERCGIMGIVERGGDVRPGMNVVVEKTDFFREMRCV